jgi:opacity protein-like surface antigen
MKKHTSKSTSWPVLAGLIAVAAATVYAAEERPYGANDPYRPYDQRAVAPAEAGASGEGLYLNTDLGISFVQDTSRLKTDPGVRFSVGPGYTLASSPRFEVGAQFETGLIYNPIRQETATMSAAGIRTTRSNSADLYQVPFLVDIVYSFHLQSHIVPFVGVGGGAVYRDISSAGPGDNSSTDPAFQALAGLRFRITEAQEIGFGYKFLATFPSGSDLLTHSLSATWTIHF